MFRAFCAAAVIQMLALFFCSGIVAGVTEKMSARQAGNGLLIFGAIDLLMIGVAVWVYRVLGAHWGGHTPPMWSLIVFGVLATLIGVMMFFASMVLLNR